MKQENTPEKSPSGLPGCADQFIEAIVRKIRYRRRVRLEVREELTSHFEDELRDCTSDDEREQKARRLIEEFGDAGLLAVLCRRAKKRCRPLWCKVLVRSVQAAGVLVLYIVLCSLRLFVGSPSLKVDYLAWLSDRTREGRAESLNAKPYFDKAAALVRDKELFDRGRRIAGVRWTDMNEPDRKILADVAQHNAQACEMLRQGVTRPHYWIEYETAVNEPTPEDAAGPGAHLDSRSADPAMAFNRAVIISAHGYRTLAQALHISIAWRASQGDISGALDDCLVLMDFGMHLEGRGTETEQLVGVAIEAMGHSAALMLLDHYGVTGLNLAPIQSRLTSLFARHESPMDVTGNKAFWFALIQRMFTDDGHGNGHVLKSGLGLAVSDWRDGVTSLLLFGYPDRREMTSRIETFWDEYQLVLGTEPCRPEYEERRAQWMALAQESLLLRALAPAQERLAALIWRLKTGRRALLTTLAVMRYEKDKESCPATLEALVTAGYLSELPIDPYCGRTFGYQRTAAGFLLYSWGVNLADDGGRQGTGQNGQPRMFADNGDWVFWPVYETPKPPKASTPPSMDEEKATEYRAVAPLNHTVRIERMGSYLKLDYELINADGKKYDLWGISEHPELTFSVYHGDAKIGVGKFEYG